jgi:MFS family permease
MFRDHVRLRFRGESVKRRIQTLVQLNLELAKLEGSRSHFGWSRRRSGVAAAVLAVYGIGFAFATVAAGLSEVLAWWLSLLIVTAIIFLLAAIAAFLAKRFARKASPPKPAAAIEEAERTIGTLQSMSERTVETSGASWPPNDSISTTTWPG